MVHFVPPMIRTENRPDWITVPVFSKIRCIWELVHFAPPPSASILPRFSLQCYVGEQATMRGGGSGEADMKVDGGKSAPRSSSVHLSALYFNLAPPLLDTNIIQFGIVSRNRI